MVRAEPLRAERERGVQHYLVDQKQRRQGAALVQIDDAISKGFDMGAHRTEHEDGLTITHKTPRDGEAKLAEIAGEWLLASADGWYEAGEEARNERAFLANTQVQSCVLAVPDHLAIAEPRRPPVIFDEAPGLVATEPSGEIFELVSVGQNC